MPKRTDLHKILIIGSGPIIISQACEFDYSGTQACKALREEGYEVILVNSNPATIMTDPEMADRTYIEPLTVECLEQIIAQERPDALLPTLGGQTGLNLSVALAERGVLDKYDVKLIGASIEAIKKAEDRELFQQTMSSVGLEMPKSRYVRTLEEARVAMQAIRLPCVIRPSFTLGGTGGGVAKTAEEFETIVGRALELSMIHETSVEESVVGWKEFELEVMRDRKDNVVIICSIENVDPMGIHTGDSITVAPAQTLTDREYQAMRDAAIKVIRAIGVETGGSNIQFAVDPVTGRMLVIEMNPRVSRSSALASKATGFPIAKIAAKLAVGYTLDELPNDITRQTPARFEPSIDYVVVKAPRFAFEKFPEADPTLTTQMKSVGETMAIGRTFKEALQKALRGLEIKVTGFEDGLCAVDPAVVHERLATPNAERIFYLKTALRLGWSLDEIFELTRIDRWFLRQLQELVEAEQRLRATPVRGAEHTARLLGAKQLGFSDQQLAGWWHSSELEIRALRQRLGIVPRYYLVDTCAAEFEAFTPYFYSTYEGVGSDVQHPTPEARPEGKKKVMILGGGPNRIGQGIEFDYCCVHAAFALKELGYETIMVNSNPETVSTDYDTSDRLYFEPVTLEDVLNIYEREQPEGVIIQLGGQTPLNLAMGLERAGVKILGTPPSEIDRAENREKFNRLIETLGLRQPEGGTAVDVAGALAVAHRVGYPCLVRPSYVLGGRAMEIIYDDEQLASYMQRAIAASPEHPILIDRFLEPAIEVDVDAISDGAAVVIGGILEHVEQAGVHSGDAAMVLPPHTLPADVLEQIRRETQALGRALRVVGLMNVQYAVKDGLVYILEVNPRASRTVPFVSKAIGVPLAKLAAQVMMGQSLQALGFTKEIVPSHIAVKESVLPFARFSGVDIILGPEMKSTGEVMGIDLDFGRAFIKSQLAAGQVLPRQGAVFVSVTDRDKPAIVAVARGLVQLGFTLVATGGTHQTLSAQGIPATRIGKIKEGHPNPLDLVQEGKVQLIINTPTGKQPRSDEARIRAAAIARGIPCITTIPGALASVEGIRALVSEQLTLQPIQVYHQRLGGVAASATGPRHE